MKSKREYAMSTNIFSSNDPNLPDIKMGLPKIGKRMPKIDMKDEDVLFNVDGSPYTLEDLANSLSNFYC